MAIKYTEEQLNSVDKSMLIQMFLNQQEQLEKVSADSFLIIKQIQAVYREEGKLKELSSKERLVQRQVVVKPLVDALFVYLKQHENEVGTEKLREAFIYVLNQEKYLRVFLTDGDVPMDNNASERAIRGFCVGKKNWQMIDTINGVKGCLNSILQHFLLLDDQFCIGGVQFQEFVDILQSGLRPLD